VIGRPTTRFSSGRYAPLLSVNVDMTSTVKPTVTVGARVLFMLLAGMGVGARAIGRDGACNSDG
jgi:hypothetical protein